MARGPTQSGSEPPWVDVLDSAPFPSCSRKITFQKKDSSGWSRRRICSWISSLPSTQQGVLSQGQFVSSEGSVPGAGLECSLQRWGGSVQAGGGWMQGAAAPAVLGSCCL